MNSPVIEAIYQRRSIRQYKAADVDCSTLHEIIRAGIQAPSGLNNQPWRFVIIKEKEVRHKLAEQTHYKHIVRGAPALITVLLDKESMYDHTKDCQAAGACIQNMLLAVESFGLGAVWLGQILKNKEKVVEILGLTAPLELMAVIAIGLPTGHNQRSTRKPLDTFIIKEI